VKSADARSSTAHGELLEHEIDWDLVDAPAARATNTSHYEDLLAEVLVDAQSYRVLAQEALHALATLTTRYRRVEQQYRTLLADYRMLRDGEQAALLIEDAP
jgi:hypothetical protein